MLNQNNAVLEEKTYGTVFNIEHFHVHDGEGIRTNVFLKGCNLHCPWCCNPESIRPFPQMAQYRNLCTSCGKCIKVCPGHCIKRLLDGRVVTDHEECSACGKCVQVCPAGAREIFGKRMSVAEVMEEVEKDQFYFMNSDGGVTLSGGEACLQPEFARQLIKAAHRRYIPTALETAGAVPWETLWQVAEEADEILIDLKAITEDKIKVIGQISLQNILNNLKLLVKHDKITTLRCPIITGFNDNEEHLSRISAIAKETEITKVDLLPFHQLGKHKYAALGKEYTMDRVPEMSRDRVEEMAAVLRKSGLRVSVGG